MIVAQHCGSSSEDADAKVQALLQSIGVQEEPGNVTKLQPATSHEQPEATPFIFPCAPQRAATSLRRSSRSYSRGMRGQPCLLPMPKTTRAKLRTRSRGHPETPLMQKVATAKPQIA